VHFDDDAIDSIECPLAEYPHFNSGVSMDTASRVLSRVCSTPELAALVVTEVNPRRDPDRVYMPQLIAMIAKALDQTGTTLPGARARA
jgi:arginase